MAQLIYGMNISLDGFVEDADGKFDWTAPSADVFAAWTALLRSPGTYLYGRKMYEVMSVWETAHLQPDQPGFTPGLEALEREFAAQWRAADKVVYSRSLATVSSARTRIERTLDVQAVRQLKAHAERDITVAGPELGGQLIAAGLVDALHLMVCPIVLGGGKHWLPRGVRFPMELVAEHRFRNGVVHLQYRPK
jgi:dihydrofolate reductase